MANETAQIVQKLWSYCNVLRDDGLSYGDYLEQLTYLLFLKMAHERTEPPWSQKSPIPRGLDWPTLVKKDGDALEVHYRHTLTELGKQPDIHCVPPAVLSRLLEPSELRSVGEPVLESGAVRRLQCVSFLGALSPRRYQARGARGDDGSRWDHSVGVASIALDVARHLRLGEEAERYGVAWGLLHDVATWPLSHTSEPAFSRITGVSSRSLRRMMIVGDASLPGHLCVGRELAQMGVEPAKLLGLFEPEAPEDLPLRMLWQVIRSPITPDTLEGMFRSGLTYGVSVPAPESVWGRLSRTLFDVVFPRSAFTVFADFWRAKGRIYADHINCEETIKRESQWTRAIEIAFKTTKLPLSLELDEEDVLEKLGQFELPHVNFALRYKPPLSYHVAEPDLLDDQQQVELEELGRHLLKSPL